MMHYVDAINGYIVTAALSQTEVSCVSVLCQGYIMTTAWAHQICFGRNIFFKFHFRQEFFFNTNSGRILFSSHVAQIYVVVVHLFIYIFIRGKHDEAVWGLIFHSSKHSIGFMSGRYEKSIVRVAENIYYLSILCHIFHFLGQNIFLF